MSDQTPTEYKGHSSREYNHEWYVKNRERKLAYDKQWQKDNRQKLLDTKKRYRDANNVRARGWSHNRRAKTQGVVINKEEVVNWHTRVCGICNLLIEGAFHIDHKIPLAKGGLHVVENLQLAHPSCNLKKKDKLLE